MTVIKSESEGDYYKKNAFEDDRKEGVSEGDVYKKMSLGMTREKRVFEDDESYKK